MWDNFKTWALDAIAKIAAQKIVLSIVGSLSPGLANAASGSFGQNPLSSLFSIFGGGGGAGSGIFGSIGTSFTNLNLALTAGVDSIGGFGAALGSLAPALGVIGGIAAIALPLLSGLFKSGGGPKGGGSASTDPAFRFTGQDTGSATEPRYFTPNTADAALLQSVQALQTSYTSILASLGGKGAANFALGYDTDPKGTAADRVRGGSTVNGNQVYAFNETLGRDAAATQAELQVQAQRALLAALQQSDLPKYVADILNSVDAGTATPQQITDILNTAQALKTAVETVGGLGGSLAKLDPEQIKSLIGAFGDLATFTNAQKFLATNFTTTADKLQKESAQLDASFASLGVSLPKTHQAFLDLLSGVDLTTDAGQKLYASLTALAPAFVDIYGTADQAAQAVTAQAQANLKLVDSAKSFFEANFYTAAEQQAKKTADEMKQITDASTALGVAIPTSVEGFRALVEGIDQSTAAGKALYAALIVLAPAVFDLGGAATAAVAQVNNLSNSIGNINPSIDARTALQQTVDTFLQQVDTVANQIANAGVGDKLALQVKLIGEKIVAVKDKINYFIGVGDLYNAETLTTEVGLYGQANARLVKQLAEFTTLKAQYGDAIAGQLIDLENWYATQQAALAGNVQALGALAGIYSDKWAAIINGTKAGVDGTLSQLDKLRQSIADYLKSLQVGDISPLTPLQKLAQSKANFDSEYTKALGGDQGALGDITKFADTYLKLARDAFASSQQYTDIFGQVTGELGNLAGTTAGGQTPQVSIDKSFAGLASALPDNGTKLASQADITALAAAIVDALAAHADAGTADTAAVTSKLAQTQAVLADALAPLR